MDSEFNEIDGEFEITPEMQQEVELINEILNTELIDNTTALNILINVANSVFNSEILNDLDRTLIAKAFDSLQATVEKGEDFFIKVENQE